MKPRCLEEGTRLRQKLVGLMRLSGKSASGSGEETANEYQQLPKPYAGLSALRFDSRLRLTSLLFKRLGLPQFDGHIPSIPSKRQASRVRERGAGAPYPRSLPFPRDEAPRRANSCVDGL
jgi:hypothetical protein